MPDTYLDSLEEWREKQNTALTSPRGWLRLSALHWIDPPAATVTLNNLCSRLNGPFGRFEFADTLLKFIPETESAARGDSDAQSNGIRLDGAPIAGPVELRADFGDQEDSDQTLSYGPLSMAVIRRGGRFALRVWDAESEAASAFEGRRWFAPDAAWRVRGERFVPIKKISLVIPDALGQSETVAAVAGFRFSHAGQEYVLYSARSSETELFISFNDTHADTYPPARYVAAEKDEEGWYLDFNKAVSPPCAVTPWATCSYAPEQNRLPFPVPAGERYR